MQLLRGRTAGITELAVSPDSRYVAAGGNGCDVWDLHAVRPRAKRLTRKSLAGVNFCTSSLLLFSAGWPARWMLWDAATAQFTEVARDGVELRNRVVIRTPDALLKVATWGDEGPGTRLATGRVVGGAFAAIAEPKELPFRLVPLAFLPQGERYVASGEWPAPHYGLYDDSTDELVVTFAVADDSPVSDAVFTPDGARLLLVHDFGLDGYDCASGKPLASLAWPEPRPLGQLAFHPGGRLAATAEGAAGVTFRDAETLEVLRVYDFAMPSVNAVAFTPDGTRCVIGNSRGKVLVFDVDE